MIKVPEPFEVVVYDRRPSARNEEILSGATWANSPAAAAEGAYAVVTSLPGPAEVAAVALGRDGVLEGIEPGAVYIDMSTSTPASIQEIAGNGSRRQAGQ